MSDHGVERDKAEGLKGIEKTADQVLEKTLHLTEDAKEKRDVEKGFDR